MNVHDHYMGQSMIKYGEYCQLELDLLLQVVPEGGIVLDIGANMGLMTVPLAQKVGSKGRVLAFEPQLQNYQALCGTLVLNDCVNVQALQKAVGRSVGEIVTPLFDPQTLSTAATLNMGAISLPEFAKQDAAAGLKVPVIPLDQLTLPRLDLMKIDVERMEIDVLTGAEQTIEQHQPFIFVENNIPAKSDDLIGLLESFGYVCFWHQCYLFNPNNYRKDPENIFHNTASLNMLCVPASQTHRVANFARAEIGSKHPFDKSEERAQRLLDR